MKYRAASVVISSEWDKNIKISFRNVPGLFRTSSNAYRFDATRLREPKAEQAGETRCDSTFAVYADRTYPKTYPWQFSSKLCIPMKSLTLELRDECLGNERKGGCLVASHNDRLPKMCLKHR
jgi:hypothetical protein